MSIDAALLIARSGLLHTQRALSNAADNVANAETAGYTRKRVLGEAVSNAGQGNGVRSLGPSRDVDSALVNEMNRRKSELSAAELRDTVLARIDEAHGDPAKSEGLGDLVGKLRTSFIELRTDPSQVVKQQAVVLNAAKNLVNRFNDLSRVVQEARQSAQDGIVSEVKLINSTLREIATLTRSIVEQKGAGQPTADIEDKRDLAIAQLSEIIAFKVVRQENGGLVLLGAGGVTLPLSENADALSVPSAFLTPQAYYGGVGTIPPITLSGADVTTGLKGGRLGEYIKLRDETLPRYQAELDIAAAEIADRFEEEGLRLFTDPAGVGPAFSGPDPNLAYAGGAQIGFAGRIEVSSVVRADVRLLRDGTHATGGFTPNPVGGPAGFTILMDRILDHSFGATNSLGANWGGFRTSGLGPDGALSSPFGTPQTIEDYAVILTASHTSDSAAAGSVLENTRQLSEALETRFTRQSRVDVDSEMASLIQLQNAYAANARVMSTAQTMWETLFGSVR
ncbi:MAG: flagellar hook-associated protein FlgK [Roseomonas sp.]|nr:flagellar hook-associated protein FlgK [Roseomonas sp.]